ncbi:RecE family exodeoxyribonuclease [Salmonella enterica]
MKNITQLVFKPKKSAVAKGVARQGTIWFDNDDPDEIDALSTLAIKEAGFKRSDFFKPVRVDHLIVDDMPLEGVFDTAFCDRYKLAEDGKSWLLPAAKPESVDASTGENTDSVSEQQKDENTTSITDSGDTTSAASADAGTTTAATNSDNATDAAGSTDATTDTSTEGVGTETATGKLPAWEFNVNGERMADVEKEMQQPVVGMGVRHRILSQFILEDKFSHNITPEQLAEVSRLELDVSDNYIQDMLLATRNAPAIHKLNTPDLWKYTDSFKKVFARDKRHPLSRMINFNQAYADAHPIDRGLLVKEWIKGNYVSRIEKSGTTSDSASAAPESQKISTTKANAAISGKPATKTTYKTIDTRIGIALTKGEITFPITAKVVEQGKAIVEADGEEFKRWSATYRVTENIQFYDEKTHIAMIRQAPRDVVVGGPELRRAYVDNYLIAYGKLDPEQIVFMPKRAPVEHEENQERVRKAGKNLRDMAAGRFNCNEEETQPTDTLADEPAAPEAVEPDTTKHHQDSQQVETESSVADDGDQDLREKFSEQLAAGRGDFVPGINDPSDPKWVHNDYSASASNEGEKTEVATDRTEDTADEVDHSEELSNQAGQENNHSEPSTDHNEPETPKTGPKRQQPEPVTKVADGVFDASVFFATTSNQVEKTEDSSSSNDDRTTKEAEESGQDKAPDKSDSMPEMLLLLRQISESLQQILASQLRVERNHRKGAAAIRGMLAMMYAAETEEDTANEE